MDIDQSVQEAAIFLDAYTHELQGFSPTGDLADARLEFEDAYKDEGGVLVLVFAIRPHENPDEPSAEVLALAQQSCDALIEAFPALANVTIEYEFLC